MSDEPNFDPTPLRRVDRPRRPDPDADARIRAEMLAAFDAAVADDAPPGLRLVDAEADEGRTPLVEPEPLVAPARRPWRTILLVAAAAVVVISVATVAWVRSEDEPLTPTDDAAADVAVVDALCRDRIAPLVDDVAGGLEDRALRNLELIAQAIADAAPELSAARAETAAALADELLTGAADVRRRGPTTESVGELARTAADGIASLPGSGGCRIAEIRGGA